jgi:hypothetical protein
MAFIFLLLVFQRSHRTQKYQQQERRERIQIVSCVNPVQKRREMLQGGMICGTSKNLEIGVAVLRKQLPRQFDVVN